MSDIDWRGAKRRKIAAVPHIAVMQCEGVLWKPYPRQADVAAKCIVALCIALVVAGLLKHRSAIGVPGVATLRDIRIHAQKHAITGAR